MSRSFIRPVSTSAYNLIKPSVCGQIQSSQHARAIKDLHLVIMVGRVENTHLSKAVIYHRLSQWRKTQPYVGVEDRHS